MLHLYIKFIIILSCYSLSALRTTMAQPCFPSEITTAAYATGGVSDYIGEVLWLTWGSSSTNIDQYPHGRHNRELFNGSTSNASIAIGGGKYLCLQAEISNLNGRISSYAPGNYTGDYLDDLYHIGGTGTNNMLVSGIKNHIGAQRVSFTITCRATVDGLPFRIAGLVLGDAESLSQTEYFHATANGKWTVVELKKNIGQGNYDVLKTNIYEGGVTKQNMRFVTGNDRETAAVSFLAFNQSAYRPAEQGYEVSFDVELQGNPTATNGTTAIALGIITLGSDGGDAPQSYGSPLHILEELVFTDDNIPVGTTVNLNTASYEPGSLEPPTSNFLGTTGPDADNGPLFSEDALGDDNNPSGLSSEEDAWPAVHKRWSYNATYKPGNTLSINIPYVSLDDAHIVGWIDFNWNGEFDESERAEVVAPAAANYATLTWTIPEDRVAKSTYVRLRYAVNEDEILSPTTVASGGEVEDHFIYILGPATTNPMLPSRVKQPSRPTSSVPN